MSDECVARWLRRIARYNPTEIELGLERVARVWQRLRRGAPARRVVTIAGTNGKGSCAHFLESLMRSSGRRVGLYTSPHLLRFNERLRVDGRPVADAELCAAFERVERARQGEPLTYFEFTTLAALTWFETRDLDVAILEVGLGGRLDAVNVVDADVAVVTRIGLDHTDWLGDSLDAIAREKAGVFRRGRPAICADPGPPAALRECAIAAGAEPIFRGVEYTVSSGPQAFGVRGAGLALTDLPLPPGAPADAFAGALLAAHRLRALPARDDIARRLRGWRLAGRLQWVPGEPAYLLDVAHNPQAAEVLAASLIDRAPRGRIHAVAGLLADKDADGFARHLVAHVHHWHAVALPGTRGRPARELAQALRGAGAGDVMAHASTAGALAVSRARAQAGDVVVVCGSFQVVGPALAWLGIYSATHAAAAGEGA